MELFVCCIIEMHLYLVGWAWFNRWSSLGNMYLNNWKGEETERIILICNPVIQEVYMTKKYPMQSWQLNASYSTGS